MNLIIHHLKGQILLRETEIEVFARENQRKHHFFEDYKKAIEVNTEFIKQSKEVLSILENKEGVNKEDYCFGIPIVYKEDELTQDQLLNSISLEKHEVFFNQLSDPMDRAIILEQGLNRLFNLFNLLKRNKV